MEGVGRERIAGGTTILRQSVRELKDSRKNS